MALNLGVKGSCHTEYTWLVNSTDQADSYILFGDRAYTVIRQAGDLPPSVAFAIDPKTLAAGSSNTSYAIIVNTAGRRSDTPCEDPWYATGKSPANITAQYQVLPGRPALSCWETSTWHLNGKEVASFDLAKLPGLKLHKFWAETVLPLEFAIPRVITLGRAAGLSALKAAAYAMAPGFILDAGASGIHDDLQRLVLASWVNSRGVLRDTTTYEGGNMSNSAKGPGGSVEVSAAKFVLQSGDVDTLSVRVLIAIPVIFVFLFIVEKIFGFFVRYSSLGRESRSRRLRDAERQRPPYTT